MAYGEVYEGTGEDLAARIAAFGQRRLRVTVEDGSPDEARADRWDRMHRRFAEVMRGAPVIERSFTTEDFYGPEA